MDNGPGYELPKGKDLLDNISYCVDCGNVMLFRPHRTCPACYLDKQIQELKEAMDDD